MKQMYSKGNDPREDEEDVCLNVENLENVNVTLMDFDTLPFFNSDYSLHSYVLNWLTVSA